MARCVWKRAADQILAHRAAEEVVVGHADWYAGNAAIAGGVLVATFDWELVADAEAVIAGFTAACYAASSTSGAGLSTPEEVAVFLRDYDVARGSSADRPRTARGGGGGGLDSRLQRTLGARAPRTRLRRRRHPDTGTRAAGGLPLTHLVIDRLASQFRILATRCTVLWAM